MAGTEQSDADRHEDVHEDVHEDKARHDEGQASTRRYVSTPEGRTVPAESKPVPEHGEETATSGGASGADDQQQGNPSEAITEGDVPQRP